MIRRTPSVIAVLTIVLIAGCGEEPTVNTSISDDETRASLAKVKESLPEDRRDDFEEAMKTLVFADVDNLGDLADGEAMARRFQDRIDGKTGEEIISEAQSVLAERRARERQQAISEIEEIATKLSPAAEEMCAKLVVERSIFNRSGGGYFGSGGSIELAVRNDTEHAISRAHFAALLLTPGRSVPWLDAEFNYQIAGGLEPGESAVWSLQPGMFGQWSNAPDDREDTVLIVRTISLDGPDGKSLTGERFTPNDETRLASLLEGVDYDGADGIRSSLASRSGMIQRWREVALRRSALTELTLLSKRKAEHDQSRQQHKLATEKAREELNRFEVMRSRFHWNDSGFITQPVVEITVRNGTSETVSRYYAQGVLSSPGRDTPWIDESFNYSVQGGIEPGETKKFKLAPNMFGGWGSAPKDRTDMILTVTINRLDGADGESLFVVDREADEVEWETEDDARLAALQEMVAEQGWN